MKQVPETSEVEIDPVKGTLKREGARARTNPYDLHALELALYLRSRLDARVTVLSMGPPQAEAVIREAYAMGADRGILLSDRAFAGADTLATAFALSQAARKAGFDLILCGIQSTDGDTAQVGPGVAEFLGIPCVTFVREIREVNPKSISLTTDLGYAHLDLEVKLPCVLTISRDLNQPRLPSLKLKKLTSSRTVEVWNKQTLPPADEEYYGLDGSPTRVERIFPPEKKKERKTISGDPREAARILFESLKEVQVI